MAELSQDTIDLLKRSGLSDADIARIQSVDQTPTARHALAPVQTPPPSVTEPTNLLAVPTTPTRLGRMLYGKGQEYAPGSPVGSTPSPGPDAPPPTPTNASYVVPASITAPTKSPAAAPAPVNGGFVPALESPGVDWQHETSALRRRAGDMLTAMPENLRGTVKLTSGYRSFQKQVDLAQRHAMGDPHVPMAADPGRSLHERGLAADFKGSPEAMQWMHEHAPEYGLDFPFGADPSHVQLAEWTKGGTPVPQKYQGDITPPSEDQMVSRSDGGGPSGATQRGMLSPAQIYRYALNAGFNPEQARTMTAIALHESGGGNPYQYNGDDPHGGSFGLTQINGAHAGAQSAMGNPQQAMNLAYQISHGGTDFTPWSSYTNGRYQQYLPQVANLSPMGPIPMPPPVLTSWGYAAGIPGAPGGPSGRSLTPEEIANRGQVIPPPGYLPPGQFMPGPQMASGGVSDQPDPAGGDTTPGPNRGFMGPPGPLGASGMMALAMGLAMGRHQVSNVSYDPWRAVQMGQADPRFPSNIVSASPTGPPYRAHVGGYGNLMMEQVWS